MVSAMLKVMFTIAIDICRGRIRDNIETRRTSPAKDQLTTIYGLQNDLSSWYSNLPPSLSYSKRNLYEQLVMKHHTLYALMHAAYQQCRLVLHSSLVPQFSGVAFLEGVPIEAVRVSAEIALSSAQSLSQLSADLLALEWDPTQIAPFFGYCMYVSASIHMTVLDKDTHLGGAARRNLMLSLKMLRAMKPYWKILERLVSRSVTQTMYVKRLSIPVGSSTDLVRSADVQGQR